MRDPLFLSVWLKGFSPVAMPVYLKKALDLFPFSKLSPGAILRVYPFSFQETPVIENPFDGGFEVADLTAAAQEFMHEDTCVQVETRWDLWQWDGDWQLKPSRVYIEVFGPDFETDRAEQIRFDLGGEDIYLPSEFSDQLKTVQSNIRSVLRLVRDVEAAFSVEKRLLWSGSGEDFAERLTLIAE
jgi:hypothetical protein